MSEAIISRRGYTAEGKPELRTETVATNVEWTVPTGIKGAVSVRLFGGGGGSSTTAGAGSGWMNNGEFSLNSGEKIQITIGVGGNLGVAGGTSSFGTYLSAPGGSAPSATNGGDGGAGGGAGMGDGGRGYQFGGGGGAARSTARWGANGGAGGTYGGGGGGSVYGIWLYNNGRQDGNFTRGGAGGTYGGGGAGIYGGAKGTYGGSGGHGYNFPMSSASGKTVYATNGTNTINIDSVPSECQGPGTRGDGNYSGWYTLMSSGSDRNDYWNGILNQFSVERTLSGIGGGGGYGGVGGESKIWYEFNWQDRYEYQRLEIYACGGGGGGYGGNGGNANQPYGRGTGGGGGYGKGADGGSGNILAGGGGGYFAKGGDPMNNGNYYGGDAAGGGGGYGPGGNGHADGGIAAGGGGYARGGSGICILQYYA